MYLNKCIAALLVMGTFATPVSASVVPPPSKDPANTQSICSPIEVKTNVDSYGEVSLSWDTKAGVTYIVKKKTPAGHEKTLAETKKGEITDTCKHKGTYTYSVLPVCGGTPVNVATVKKLKIKAHSGDLELKVSGREIDIVGKSAEKADGYEVVVDGKKKTTMKKKLRSEGEADTTVEYKVRAYKKDEKTGEKIYTDTITRYVYVSDYDPDKAIEYAEQYAEKDKYNPEYHDYNPQGGDCANFVSQCLKAGGLEETDEWYYTDKGSSAWISCQSMYAYFSQKYKVIHDPTYEDFQKGDIVMRTHLHHVVICSGIGEDGIPLICAHNDSHLNDPLYGDPSDWIIIRPGSGAVSKDENFSEETEDTETTEESETGNIYE